MQKNIEVEIRSLLSKTDYTKLNTYFKKSGKFLGTDTQTSYYFKCDQDLRIQLNSKYAKIWLKKGNLHDEHREELEIRVARKDFKTLEQLFLALGYETQIKWFRKRNDYKWKGYSVSLDFTKGYGYILEVEKLCTEKDKLKTLTKIKEIFKTLGVEITPKEDFDKKFAFYKANWKKLV